jgi:hypothetical protein
MEDTFSFGGGGGSEETVKKSRVTNIGGLALSLEWPAIGWMTGSSLNAATSTGTLGSYGRCSKDFNFDDF